MIETLSIEVINSLTLSELDALRYIDKNKDKVLKLSIQELSKMMFVSTATIIRLCKKLGFSGYAEMKYVLKKDTEENKTDIQKVGFDESIRLSINNIKNTLEGLNEESVNEIVNILNSDMNIYFFGKGLTYTILQYASKELLSHNRSNIIFEDTHIAYLNAENMSSKDCVFLASLSGNTHQVVRMGQIAKSRGAKVITITGTKDNDLAKIGDCHFSIVTEENNSKIDNISRAPMLIILNIILEEYFRETI